jgi:hypothetical protein
LGNEVFQQIIDPIRHDTSLGFPLLGCRIPPFELRRQDDWGVSILTTNGDRLQGEIAACKWAKSLLSCRVRAVADMCN